MDNLQNIIKEGKVDDENDQMKRITDEGSKLYKFDAKSWVNDIITCKEEIVDEDDADDEEGEAEDEILGLLYFLIPFF